MARWIRRPFWWVPVALFVGVLTYGSAVQDVVSDERVYGGGEPLVGTVAEGYDGGDRVPVLYRHPQFGAVSTDVGLSRWAPESRPEAGDAIALRADRANPFDVRLPVDDPETPPLWWPLAFTLPLVGAAGRRWWTGSRAQRLVAASRPGVDGDDAREVADGQQVDGASELVVQPGGGTEMSGRFRSRGGRRGETVVLDLFPVDAAPRQRTVCSVPLVSSSGLPLNAPETFLVTVHGRPGPWGRVVGEVPDGVLWPRRRALLLPQWFRGVRRAGESGEALPALEQRKLRAPKQAWPGTRGRVLLAGGLLVVAVVGGVLATMSTLREAGAADDLPEGSVEVPAEVVGDPDDDPSPDDGLLDVGFRLPGEPDDGELHTSVAAVPNAAAWPEGAPLLVVVDPDYLVQVQLPPEPYRAAEPVIWSWMPTVAAGLWLVRTLLWARGTRRLTSEEPARWYPVDVRRLDRTTFVVARPGASMASCLLTLPYATDDPPRSVARTLSRSGQVYADRLPAPGETPVLRFGTSAVATTRATTIRDRPWRRRLRRLVHWMWEHGPTNAPVNP